MCTAVNKDKEDEEEEEEGGERAGELDISTKIPTHELHQ
jgi:hypothetical protein